MHQLYNRDEDTEYGEGTYESDVGGCGTGSTSSGTSGADSTVGGAGAGTSVQVHETVADRANEAKQKITEFGRKTADQIDAQREPVASTLKRTALALHQHGENAASAAHSTADKLESTADYLRSNDVKAIMSDIQGLARRYPGQTLAAAAAVGFLLGRLFRNSA